MFIPRAAALLLFAFPLSLTMAQQAPANAPAASATPAAAPASAQTSYTDLLKPSLSNLYGTLADLKLDKWKNGNVRAEAEHDTASIVDDLNQKVPDLLKNADAAPARMGAVLPLVRNFAALYDVSLRVLDAARIAAPADQAARIQDAMNKLATANRALYDRMEQAAAAQETHIGDLEAKIKTQQQAALHPVPVSAPVPVCSAPVKTVAAKRKPAAKPAQNSQQSGGSSGSGGSQQQQKPQN